MCMREKAVEILCDIRKHKLKKFKAVNHVFRAISYQKEELINDENYSADVSLLYREYLHTESVVN